MSNSLNSKWYKTRFISILACNISQLVAVLLQLIWLEGQTQSSPQLHFALCFSLALAVITIMISSNLFFQRCPDEVQIVQVATDGMLLMGEYQKIAHDLRSPISALNILQASIGDLSEGQKELLETAILRLNAIAKELDKK